MNKRLPYFSKGELLLWFFSLLIINVAFWWLDGEHYLTLFASIIGVTSLIFNAKGNPIGQFLMIAFSVLYGIISWNYAYYGEMITYLGMTAPMALFALISWLKHPSDGQKNEVAVNRIKRAEVWLLTGLTLAITIGFYFLLAWFNTSNLILSTVSVATSFVAVYLTFRRSAFFALGYAANDVILIALWTIAALASPHYWSVVICFVIFFLNDIYGFINWRKMRHRQERKQNEYH